MKRTHSALFLGLALWLVAGLHSQAADVITITYPFLGVTHIVRMGSPPEFPRNVKMHVVKIDLGAEFLSFQFTAHTGTRDTLKADHAAISEQFRGAAGDQRVVLSAFPIERPQFWPWSGSLLRTGNIYSPFELPTQNYALVRDSPAINIDPNNNASIVHRDPAFSDGPLRPGQAVDGLHVRENATVWNAFSGSAQIVTRRQDDSMLRRRHSS